MAILGVLLGITMCGVIALGIFSYVSTCATGVLVLRLEKAEERVSLLEKRKALLAEAGSSYPKPASADTMIGSQRPKFRTWNEDAAPVEAKH